MTQGMRFAPAANVNKFGGHWMQEGKREDLNWTLNSLMQMDHVIRVDDDGLVWEDATAVYAPEFYVMADETGQILKDGITDMHEQIERQGWEAARGWSLGQDAIMHDSQFIGAGLAEHIVSTPGLWVACEVRTDEDREDNSAGWIVLHQEIEGTDK